MKKIPDEVDNPFDNILIKLSDILCPLFKKTNHTPNMITTYSLIFGLLAVFCLYKGYIFMFAITYIISYFFDCLDGHFARKYKMTTIIGDLYDHIKDIIIYIMILYVIYIKYKKCIRCIDIIFILLLFFMCSMHLGCQQKWNSYKSNDKELLDKIKFLCIKKNDIYFVRFFGLGTFILISILLIFIIDIRCKKLHLI